MASARGKQVLKKCALAVLLACSTFILVNCFAADRFVTPILIGDSWSDDRRDWPNFTLTVAWDEYRNHAIRGEWLSVQNAASGEGMAANISAYLDQHPEADSIIIQGGINDIGNGIAAEVIKSALAYMVTEAKARSNIFDIIVMSPGPFGGYSGWTRAMQDELYEYINWLPGFCASQQIDCYDTYAAVGHPDNLLIISDGTQGAPDYDTDGVHVNREGAVKVAADMDALIETIRNRPVP